MSLRLGDIAPDFEQESSVGRIKFHDWLGDSWGVLFSHPKNFTRRAMAAACGDLGITGVTAHRARGTWITHLLRQGTPLPEVQEMARHKSKATTLDYYEQSSEVKKEAQKKLAKGMGFA